MFQTVLFLIGGCWAPAPTLEPLEPELSEPVVALDAADAETEYAATADTCFLIRGTSRGTGYAQHPEQALGAMWSTEADCQDDCAWTPSVWLYSGSGVVEDRNPVEVFSGFTRFDDSTSTDTLGAIFGMELTSGSVAELSAVRTYEGMVDLRDDTVQDWFGTFPEQYEGQRGFGWNVQVIEWSATFLQTDDGTNDGPRYLVDGDILSPSDTIQVGYEVYVCVTPF
jgi:hypothetical protein